MPDMEESAQPAPADPSEPELPNGAGQPDEPAVAVEEVQTRSASPDSEAPAVVEEAPAAVEEAPAARSAPSKDAETNAEGWRPYTMGELLGEAAEAAAGRSEYAEGNGAGSATPDRSRLVSAISLSLPIHSDLGRQCD
jgi:hypothetical protein